MKKIFLYLATLFLLISGYSCSDDDVSGKSIFVTDPPVRNEFDKWLITNFINTYNVDIKYKMEDIESSMGHELVPAELSRSIRLAKLVKFLWFEAYDEISGPHFTRAYAPKVMHFIGSPAYNNNNTMVLGTAEGGMKVTLYNVNHLVINAQMLNDSYFHTMHHEFAHILHQTKSYDTNYQRITEGDYIGGNWYQHNNDAAYKRGFVSAYSRDSPDEDFVEMYSRFLTRSPQAWDNMLVSAGADGKAIIEKKFNIMQNYFKVEWGIDVYELRSIIQRRTDEIQFLDLDTLD